MELSVLSAFVDNTGGGKSLLDSMLYAVLPVAKVFIVCFLGFLMASKYVNVLPANGRKLLNGLVFSLLLPCLIFSQLGRAITLEKMRQWWFIPVNVVLSSLAGSLIGFIVACMVRPPYPYFKFTIIQIGIGNIGNVPLVLISALCRDASNPFGDSDKCSADGTAYIAFGQWVGAIILYTYVFQMLAPPPSGSFDFQEEEKLPIKDLPVNPSPNQIPLLAPQDLEPSLHSTRKGKAASIIWFLMEKLQLKQILQPPIIASVLAMVLGCVPFLKRLVLTDDAPLFFFTDSCIILGLDSMLRPMIVMALSFPGSFAALLFIQRPRWDPSFSIYLSREAMIPCILLALGGNLIDGPGSSKLGMRTTTAIIIGRLVLVPPAGLGIVTLADKLGFLPAGDKMFKFVLLLQHSMPTSVLSGAVASLRGCGREAAAVLFWVHIFAVFSMAGWIVLYLNILF